ncbi:MAG: tetratricopeptide repeat protein [Chitinispirillaceae bacterium]
MRKYKEFNIYSFLLVFALLVCFAGCDPMCDGVSSEISKDTLFIKVVDLLKNVQTDESLIELNIPSSVSWKGSVDYLKSRKLFLSGDYNSAKEIFIHALEDPHVIPESLAGLIELYNIAGKRDSAALITAILGQAVPLGPVGRLNNMEEINRRFGSLRQGMHCNTWPNIDRRLYRSVADRLYETKDYKRASQYYKELLYSTYILEKIKPESYGEAESWYSLFSADIWFRIALCHYHLGEFDQAKIYILKTLFCDYEGYIAEVRMLINETNVNETDQPLQYDFHKISLIYKSLKAMSIHPRVFEIHNALPKMEIPDSIKTLHNNIEMDWRQYIEKLYLCTDNKVILYGRFYGTPKEAFGISVPSICSKPAIDSIRVLKQNRR